MYSLRRVQAIVIYDPRSQSNSSESEEPQNEDRPNSIVGCNQASSGSKTLSTNVRFFYKVETDTANFTDSTLNVDIPKYMNSEMMEKVAVGLCGDDETIGGLPDCVLSVSAGSRDEKLAKCDPLPISESCHLYEGSLKLTHKDSCSSTVVDEETMGVLRDTVDTEAFLSAINNYSGNRSGVFVTNVDLVDPPAEPEPEPAPPVIAEIGGGVYTKSSMSEEGGFTAAGKAIMAILGLCFLAFLMLMYAMSRYYKRRTGGKKVIPDDVSFVTKWSNSDKDSGEHVVAPASRDMSFQPNTIDVHRCKSALCEQCYGTNNQVRMIPVKGFVMNAPIDVYQDDALSQSNEERMATEGQMCIQSMSLGDSDDTGLHNYKEEENDRMNTADKKVEGLDQQEAAPVGAIEYVRNTTPQKKWPWQSTSKQIVL